MVAIRYFIVPIPAQVLDKSQLQHCYVLLQNHRVNPVTVIGCSLRSRIETLIHLHKVKSNASDLVSLFAITVSGEVTL